MTKTKQAIDKFVESDVEIRRKNNPNATICEIRVGDPYPLQPGGQVPDVSAGIIKKHDNPAKPDMVNKPPQYQKLDMTYEPIKVIQAWDCDFEIGSALKYLGRYKAKWNPIEDLEKAIRYIQYEIEKLKLAQNPSNG